LAHKFLSFGPGDLTPELGRVIPQQKSTCFWRK
jgi:hypothetical protein